VKRHRGVVNYPIEDIGLGMSNLRIEFTPPSQLGFSTDAIDDLRVGTIIAGLVGDMAVHLQHTIMIHVFLNGAGSGLTEPVLYRRRYPTLRAGANR
jgi:hypothetical protein